MGLAASLCTHAMAAGYDAREDRLLEIEAARAPLAISGDGAWRLHVDAHDVLHRTSLADPARDSTVQLPPGVQLLSASNDGTKVALATRHQCVGLVDFGAAAGVSWRPWIVNGDGLPLGPDGGAWVAQVPAACGTRPSASPVAISADGRWIATPEDVVETATHRVVASLPTARAAVLRLQFVDHDARLLVATATLAERGAMSVSVWDLASKRLVNDIEVTDAPLAARAALQVDFSPQTGALFAIDDRRREHALRAATPGTTPVPLPLDLVQLSPGVCGASPRVRAQVSDDLGASFVVDPYGRWIASARPLDAAHDTAELAMGARSVLVVQDMATGRQLERVTSKYALDGLAATPDGARVFALASQPVEPETGETIAGWPAVPDDERLVEVTLPPAATNAARDGAKAWDAGVCKEPGETPDARAVARADHLLKPLWSRDLGPATAPAGAQDKPCSTAPLAALVFKTPDGGLWLDLDDHVAKLDPATGMTGASLPTPRSKNVCSVVAPGGAGFLNATGDTLTWRPLAAAADPARRRVVERRHGSVATLLPVDGDVVRVAWSTSGGDGAIALADYDANGKRVREFATSNATFSDDASAATLPAPCHDARGTPLSIGYDWRAGPFGSQRGTTCGPLPGMARLVWWSGATIAPRADRSDPQPRAQSSIDGAIAVAVGDTQLHVVNLALQREIAQIALDDGFDGRTWVIASKRLVLLQATGSDGHRWLRAYALP